MIVELLRPGKIVTGLAGEFPQALEELFRRSSFPERLADFRAAFSRGEADRYSYLGNEIAVPHARIDGLPAPEIILGLSGRGIRLNGNPVKIVLFIATPAEQTEEHLQILQRLSALLPTIKDELLAQREPAGVLRVMAKGEREAGL